MEETFDIADTIAGFTAWVNGYGLARDSRYIPRQHGLVVEDDDRHLLYVVADADRSGRGEVDFVIKVVEPVRLNVKARLLNIQGKEAPIADPLKQHFQELCEAIRRKYAKKKGTSRDVLERVKECHRLITQERYSLRAALAKAKTHYDSYQAFCKEATGDDPYP